MIYPAHLRPEADGSVSVQTVQEHCRNTAELAARCLRGVPLSNAAYLAGLLHDLGKYTVTFKDYLERGTGRRGSVIHTHAAVRYLLERYHHPGAFTDYADMAAEVLAYAAGAHHGLFDCVDARHRSGFDHRLAWEDAPYREAVEQFLLQCAPQEELDRLFQAALAELTPLFAWTNRQTNGSGEEIFFHLGLLARLLLSAVIDGDRQDTAAYLNRAAPPERTEDLRPLWRQLLVRLEKRLGAFPADTPIQRARREISRQCRDAGEWPCGVYRLNVPTGGGKTLSSLRFALAHAARHGKRRILFAFPLLSILEQNAAVLRAAVGEDSLILEHHSNLVRTRSGEDRLDEHELLAENWSAPIVITTLVQLLNTLFSGKTTCIRRFQALCDSVLVIDEVQTVPSKLITLFNLAVNFLTQVCGATVVLCSATQPCLEEVEHPISGALTQLVPSDAALWAPFRRTEILDAGQRRLDEIPDWIRGRLEEVPSLLAVCNNRREAEFLYRQLERPGLLRFHLSASMCPQHRRDTLARLTDALSESRNGGPKVLCVSTQVIEAGVDISFGAVVRLTAGMDSVIQSAGRCNRNGESDALSPVHLLTCSDENLSRLREIQAAKTATLQLLSDFRRHPEAYQNDLASEPSIRQYYSYLYLGMAEGARDYPAQEHGSLFDLLSVNCKYAESQPGGERYGLHQAFALAGGLFEVFDQETSDVLVPYGEGRALIEALSAPGVPSDPRRQRELLERAKPYTVSLYQFQLELLERRGGLVPFWDGAVLALQPTFYDSETGLVTEPNPMRYLEV